MAVTPSTDDLKATLDPFGVASSYLLAANTKYQAVTTRAKDLAGNPLDQNEAQPKTARRKSQTFTTGVGK